LQHCQAQNDLGVVAGPHAALRPLSSYTSAQLVWWTPASPTPDAAYFNSGSNHSIVYQLNGSTLSDSSTPGNGANWSRVTDACNWAERTSQVRMRR